MHEAHRLDGFPEVARRFGRDLLARVGDLEEFGFADRVGGLLGHLPGQGGVPLGEGDDGLEHDDDGLEQVPLAQGVGARAELPSPSAFILAISALARPMTWLKPSLSTSPMG